MFVVTGEDAEGPVGEWLRVDEETKAAMEAKARRKIEKKKAKAAAKLAKAAGKAEPHRGHAEAAVGEATRWQAGFVRCSMPLRRTIVHDVKINALFKV